MPKHTFKLSRTSTVYCHHTDAILGSSAPALSANTYETYELAQGLAERWTAESHGDTDYVVVFADGSPLPWVRGGQTEYFDACPF